MLSFNFFLAENVYFPNTSSLEKSKTEMHEKYQTAHDDEKTWVNGRANFQFPLFTWTRPILGHGVVDYSDRNKVK